MGVFKPDKRSLATPGEIQDVQVLRLGSTATRITPTGVTFINSTGGDKTFSFSQKPRKGATKTLICDINSTGEVTVTQKSTTVTLQGTTNGTIKFTTTGSAAIAKRLQLIGLSTASWAVIQQSTAITLSA